MRQHFPVREPPLLSPINTIIETVAAEWGITRDELLGSSRKPRFAHPRIIAAQLARELTNASFPAIAKAFGRHHTSIVHAVQRAPALLAEHSDYAEKRAAVLAHLGQIGPR
jgi:chromosomal replication initiator protein